MAYWDIAKLEKFSGEKNNTYSWIVNAKKTITANVATIPDTTTLEYYQSIYTHCKQRFNIPDGIEIVERTLYQYIENRINNYLFGNYNISEVRSNLYNNLVYYSQLGTKDLNSETLATYFQELNYNIIKYCEEKYSVQSKYSFDFESETETGNKGKQKVKQHSKTVLNTPILPKTTAKHLQTPEQGTSVKLPLSITPFPISLARLQTPNSPLNHFFRPEDFQSPKNSTQQQKPISTSTNIIEYLQENKSNHSENLESEETESEQGEATENKEKMTTAYIAKIPEFIGEDNNTSPQKWLNKVQKTGDQFSIFSKEQQENAFKNVFLQQFTDNNISITLRNHFHNIKQETSKTVITYLGRFNKLLKQIRQLETNNYYSDAQILDQFIAELKDKLIKKVCLHALTDLATAIRHAKSYEMAMEEANHTKLTNSQKRLKAILQTNNNSNNNHKDINSHNDTTKTILDHHPTTNLKIVIIVKFQNTGNKIVGNYKETNKTRVINIILHYNNLITNLHHQPIIHQDHKIKTYQQEDWFNITNLHSKINCRVTTTESIQITSWFPEILVSKDPITITLNPVILQYQRNRIFNKLHFLKMKLQHQDQTLPTIPFHQLKLPKMPISNESPFLLSNPAVNKQKAITAMYTEATVKEKPIHLILGSGLARNRLAQTVIVTADGMKRTPVEEIDDFLFTIDGITIPVKVLVMDALQYQALVRNNWLLKANANLN
ncbi:hypothetical protein G9A89_020683 [Geosiphon pyriformis]|nr:hypothetical protein G9A89_020683 [Geosiphon pyriformis]